MPGARRPGVVPTRRSVRELLDSFGVGCGPDVTGYEELLHEVLLRRLRDLTWYRVDLVEVRHAEKKNRVEKLLEDACVKLSVVAPDILLHW